MMGEAACWKGWQFHSMDEMTPLDEFRATIRVSYPSLANSLEESVAQGGARLRQLADKIVTKYSSICSNEIRGLARAYANLVAEVNKLQLKYELSGVYAHRDYDKALHEVYSVDQRMTDYMLGLVCTQFAWPNHFELMCFFEDEFIRRIHSREVLEIAPGHGLLGLTLLEFHPKAILTGVDISPSSVRISRAIAAQFKQQNARYIEQNALALPDDFAHRFDTVICGELMEHLPAPELLVRSIARVLVPGGRAYVTAAITAAAPDHIYEFKSEKEILDIYIGEGLQIDSYLCSGTRPLTDHAKGAPRTLGAVLRLPGS
jgi:SAM-dependent methyltransferase